jgi:GT2 family glycosyltransferase
MVRKRASDEIGYFWDALDFCHSHDYALRLADAGWKLACAKNSIYWHKPGQATVSTFAGDYWSAKKIESERLMDEHWGKRWRGE